MQQLIALILITLILITLIVMQFYVIANFDAIEPLNEVMILVGIRFSIVWLVILLAKK